MREMALLESDGTQFIDNNLLKLELKNQVEILGFVVDRK